MHEAPGDQLAWETSLARIETARAKCDNPELQRESLCNRIAALLCQPACEKPVDHVAQQLIEQVQQISRAELNEIRTLLRPPAPARKCLEVPVAQLIKQWAGGWSWEHCLEMPCVNDSCIKGCLINGLMRRLSGWS